MTLFLQFATLCFTRRFTCCCLRRASRMRLQLLRCQYLNSCTSKASKLSTCCGGGCCACGGGCCACGGGRAFAITTSLRSVTNASNVVSSSSFASSSASAPAAAAAGTVAVGARARARAQKALCQALLQLCCSSSVAAQLARLRVHVRRCVIKAL